MPSVEDTSSSLATSGSRSSEPELVVVHPLVLLSIVDHLQRSNLTPGKRVVGIVLGNWSGRTVNITNSYAIPFEENEKDPNVWYIDHNYHETMSELCKKVSAKEVPLGWYHTGPKLRSSDLTIHELISRYCPYTSHPILCIVDPNAKGPDSPVQTFHVVTGASSGQGAAEDPSIKTFAHLPSIVEADESEAVGVEYLLRDVKDSWLGGTMADNIRSQQQSLLLLSDQLATIDEYLDSVLSGKLPIRQNILSTLQDMFNSLPDTHSEVAQRDFTRRTNDQLSMIYLCHLARTTVAINDLINNKRELSLAEKASLQ